MNDRPPVAFRSAKPVNPKERHPITGERLTPAGNIEAAEHEVTSRYGETHIVEAELKPTRVNYTPDPRINRDEFTTVVEELKKRRAELDNAIALLERLAP